MDSHRTVDGDLMGSHSLFYMKPTALLIIIYTDKILLCNHLGSHASKNKLLMIYYTLGNINPKDRSKLSAIRLLVLARSVGRIQEGII